MSSTAVYGRWAPLGVPEVVELLSGSGVRWWVAGGRAARVGATPRRHADTDIVLHLDDLPALRRHLRDRHLWEEHRGTLRPVAPDDEVRAGREGLWLRRDADHPWVLHILVDRCSTEDAWVFKKHPTVTVPWAHALRRHDDVDYLAPELALLHKAHLDRDKDRDDLAAAALEPAARHLLVDTLTSLGHHEWASLAE